MQTFKQYLSEKIRENPNEEWLRLNNRMKESMKASKNDPSKFIQANRLIGSMLATSRAQDSLFPKPKNTQAISEPGIYDNQEKIVGIIGTGKRLEKTINKPENRTPSKGLYSSKSNTSGSSHY